MKPIIDVKVVIAEAQEEMRLDEEERLSWEKFLRRVEGA